MTKLQREWAARLKADGFHDLEGPDRDGPLSNAGKPHPKEDTADGHEHLARLHEDGAAYQRAARSLLWGRRWADVTERRIWQMHVDGAGLREITATLEVSWARASKVLRDCQARLTKPQEVPQWHDREKMRRLIKRTDPKVLEKLARLLARTLTLC
jgi:hypothetical protein